jgi:hypothetical protein
MYLYAILYFILLLNKISPYDISLVCTFVRFIPLPRTLYKRELRALAKILKFGGIWQNLVKFSGFARSKFAISTGFRWICLNSLRNRQNLDSISSEFWAALKNFGGHPKFRPGRIRIFPISRWIWWKPVQIWIANLVSDESAEFQWIPPNFETIILSVDR